MAPKAHHQATLKAREQEREVIDYWRKGVGPAFVFLTPEREQRAVWDGPLGFLLCVVMIDDDGHAIDRQNGEPSPPFFLFSLREWHAHGMTTRYQAFVDGRIRELPRRHTLEGARSWVTSGCRNRY